MPGHIDLKSDEADLAALVARVRQGEEIVLTEDGQAVARLSPAATEPARPPGPEDEESAGGRHTLFGRYRGQAWAAPEAFDPDEELTESFYNGELFPAGSGMDDQGSGGRN